MIKRFINRLLGKDDAATPVQRTGKRVEVPQEVHGIDPALVDDKAVKVVETLQQAGHTAYIVGGAVRDMMLGLRPKDFDVATDATPEQVKALFRRAFIIGRRFRIVHVVYGRGREHEVIEVSTFRANLDASAAEQVAGNEKTSRAELQANKGGHVVDASGRVLRDNVWGPQIEDAARRDFTVNALYYDPTTRTVVDYHQGIADAKKRLLRMIGDPAARYREDPVRIVRAVRFAAKLGFEIEPKTLKPVHESAALLEAVPISRLFDEMIKLLQTGHALKSIEQLRRLNLLAIFPLLDAVLADAQKNPAREAFIQAALADTDRRVAEGKPVAPSFLLACLLWHEVLAGWQRRKAQGTPPFPALQDAVDAAFDARIGDISGRGKLGTDMREIWTMQPRFERRSGNTPASLVEQPRFRAGFDFLRLRADTGEVPAEFAEWWEDYSLGSDEERRALVELAREQEHARRVKAPPAAGRVTAVRKPKAVDDAGDGPDAETADGAEDAEEVEAAGAAEAGEAPARKRRRRRRKPASQRDGGETAAVVTPASPDDKA
ncbi:MAG TPA: polynucleotide adenylyltransferase PcnB [Methylibium sp.]|uniref:polynucleotide adenylyltransferase PcnB n=1 Tax=Methylibium sp. TaxID=2067992 RepID=UPI002DBED624|nr:polynucleotide adenylyltransferase PcnB [Methylibium sp.]HEU4459360.1 polynucleotide adenylyltransferase PcnB [Methylibium sp.]